MITKIPAGWRIVTDGNCDRFWFQFQREPVVGWLFDSKREGQWVDYREEHVVYDGTDWFRVECNTLEEAKEWLLNKLNKDIENAERYERSKQLIVALQGGYDDER